jgi:predicted enzyme related to lactoylglutathione lyase
MKRVTGIGGIFFKCNDTGKVRGWYRKHLGFKTDNYGCNFMWKKADNPEENGFTLWSPLKNETRYFEPSVKEFIINFRFGNIGELVKILETEGVTIVDEIETFEYGKFVHILDIEGNKIELWEPNDEEYKKIAGDNILS